MAEFQVDQEVVNARVARLVQLSDYVAQVEGGLAELIDRQTSAQWSAASPVTAYVESLSDELEKLRLDLGTLTKTLNTYATELRASAARLTAQDQRVEERLSGAWRYQ
ncbi:hypothetical protein [Cellulomonas soli]|uniref:Uncharacterized protein n=1 Tax=Cellulomonas soli TaxID=931535 RepID=A0A512PJ03_9CELL|nr:hypothetical protein [Cellulomonas soli]NYI58002.1 hypothetical protein [Cellulomonas soli]GEP71132.1 hypothetical protein CSO01_38470 [Cellulomonas soli]